ncbi:hypothetical protein DFH07DRAFT_805863 [Mycena maculata]|uniref:RRM domain-containing protein n=1 Tax=Mycena maculata TaxID=230809 RepID=A0AAD7JRR3_9AGAR|nr:hypothetical protein DFH07DRAFT_805863 [Mycena maculata]
MPTRNHGHDESERKIFDEREPARIGKRLDESVVRIWATQVSVPRAPASTFFPLSVMSDSQVSSRSSGDSASGQLRPDRKQSLKPHPPRLQHSPSMPNIWFPPHSGPIPPRLIETCANVLKRPPTPPAHDNSNGSKNADARDTSVALQDAQTHPCGVNGAGKEPPRPQSAKINRRRRMNYDQPNVLLTPPLTPSSSIRTAGSIESSVSYNTSADSGAGSLQRSTREEDIGFTDADIVSTRFLLIRNVSRKVTSEVLQFAILRSLAATKSTVPHPTAGVALAGPPTNAGSVVSASSPGLPGVDTIKGVLLRYHESHGIAILAFYDVRQAKSAQALLSTPTAGTLANCVGDERRFGGQRGWFDCAFVTAKDLAEMVGKSPFLTETQGTFLFAAEVNAIQPDAGGIANSTREINIATLTNVLKSYGAVRSFGVAQEKQQSASRKTFRVEYYDIREANAAYSALDEQVLFGMRISTLGRDLQSLETGQVASSKLADSENGIPFPTSHVEKSSIQPLIRFEAPGQQAQIRERFLFIDTAGRTRPRSISAGHESLEGSLRSVPPSSTDSPPYFYTSPPTSPTKGILLPPAPRTPDSHNRRASNHLFFDAVGRSYTVSDQPHHIPTRPRSVSFSSVAGAGHEHEEQKDSVVVTPLKVVHDHDRSSSLEYCYPPLPPPQPYYTGCPTPPLPPAFPYAYPQHHTQLVPSGFPGCPPSPLGYGYDYDQQAHAHAVMNMNMGNWAFEQAMMVPTNFYPALPFPGPTSPGGEHWQGHQTPSPQHTAHFHYPPHSPDSPLLPKLQPPAHPPFSQPIHLPPPPSPVPPPRAVVPAPGTPNSAGAAERNQLNLARIEDGQDTRTTVMIKNIPNKMSDKDLMAYIGSVCARKIDFLYLRMDFQNGCNVGYAFVNFINVQDLLRFAKVKLGEKWNMFSSEKVLQMSYANYQGKEALVEKFKNSCIMDEIPAWRPKIFYSDPGPEQGLPEPFPAPTHMKRKERSSYNRGPLYVPGMMGGLHSSQNRRQQADDYRDRGAAPTRHNERPRRLRDVDEPNMYALSDGMASMSLGKKLSKK